MLPSLRLSPALQERGEVQKRKAGCRAGAKKERNERRRELLARESGSAPSQIRKRPDKMDMNQFNHPLGMSHKAVDQLCSKETR